MWEDEDADWGHFLRALSAIGALEETDAGHLVRFTDTRGRTREVAVRATPEDWGSYVSVMGHDAEEEAARVASLLPSSPAKIKALVLNNSYEVLLVPYNPGHLNGWFDRS